MKVVYDMKYFTVCGLIVYTHVQMKWFKNGRNGGDVFCLAQCHSKKSDSGLHLTEYGLFAFGQWYCDILRDKTSK